jgi:hypothetical protein
MKQTVSFVNISLHAAKSFTSRGTNGFEHYTLNGGNLTTLPQGVQMTENFTEH